MYALKIFSRKWILFTILVVLAMIGLVRLGFWQLDRMDQKVAYNTTLAERWRMEPYDLTTQPLPADRTELAYRRIQAAGEFDYTNQILIADQVYAGTSGYVVVTPLVLSPNRAVLVARGWVPYDKAPKQTWPEFEEPANLPVTGIIHETQVLPEPGGWLAWVLNLFGVKRAAPPPLPPPPATPRTEWYRIDIPAIQQQLPYQLEPVYIEQMPEAARSPEQFPIRQEPPLLDEGNHLSYAIQWFTFALVLGFGYIMLVRHRERLAAGLIPQRQAAAAVTDGTAVQSAGPQEPTIAVAEHELNN